MKSDRDYFAPENLKSIRQERADPLALHDPAYVSFDLEGEDIDGKVPLHAHGHGRQAFTEATIPTLTS